jgi:hypothetical protein
MEYNIRLEQHAGHPLAVVPRRARSQELATVVPDACGTVWSVVRAQQLPGAGRHVAVYLDEQINLEVGVELAAPFAGYGEVVGSATPAGPVAAATHVGPYGQLHKAHAAVRLWCRTNGYTVAGPNWEVYGHWQDDWNSDPTKICTDVFYLLLTNISHAMVINGWALASHSSLHPAEIIARENKRGLWRGRFVTPAEWRAGKRLPGEK